LTLFGSIARYLPQSGGLLIAYKFATGEFSAKNLMKAGELFGALCLAKYKTPGIQDDYEFPFDPQEIIESIEDAYPIELFPEIYDQMPNNRNKEQTIREFNPAGGYIIKEWLNGVSWEDLAQIVTTETFGSGDMMGLLYRTGTYFQSIASLSSNVFSKSEDSSALLQGAKVLREQILRPPLSYSFS